MENFKKTKIIATIGPASEDKETMKSLIESGVNIFRFNMKHNTPDWHLQKIKQAREISKDSEAPLGILIDLQGPEIRVMTKEDKEIELAEGEEITLTCDVKQLEDFDKAIFIKEPLVTKHLDLNDKFSIDDGKLYFLVTEKNDDFLKAKAAEDYTLGTNKSLNLVQKDIPLPSLTEADLEKLDLGTKLDPDFIALSFVRSKEDIEHLRSEMKKRNVDAEIVAKIESQKGMDNIDEIIDTADAVMVARGDLGIETPIEGVTHFQKETIIKGRKHHKATIVATQMLESMVHSSLPTRAEAADVSNAVFDLTDATMLSGETATGKNPVLAAATMSKIIAFNEKRLETDHFDFEHGDVTKRIAQAVMSVAKHGETDKIVALTASGYTADILSALRPTTPIIAVTDNEKTYGKLSINYGVFPILTKWEVGDVFAYQKIIDHLIEIELLSKGDRVIMLHGQRLGEPGNTNSLIFLEL